MAKQNAIADENQIKGLLVESSTTPGETVRLWADPTTHALVVSGGGGGGGGGDASAANQVTTNAEIGIVTETAPATDTASSGLNGRLQRIAQRLTSIIALLPASLGQKAKAASLAVTLASDQDALPITDNAGSLTIDAAAIPTSAGQKARASSLGVTLSTEDVTALAPSVAIPTSAGQKARASSLGVTLSTEDVAALRAVTAGTGTLSSVASSASSVTILASNSSRKRFSVYNDSTQILYLNVAGSTASTSAYTVQIPTLGYFESAEPINTGTITGIWASANGNARVTEFA